MAASRGERDRGRKSVLTLFLSLQIFTEGCRGSDTVCFSVCLALSRHLIGVWVDDE